MSNGGRWASISFIFCLLSSQFAVGCPFCHSKTAEEVRAGIASTVFDGVTIPSVLLPFVVLLVVICLLHVDFKWQFIARKWSKND